MKISKAKYNDLETILELQYIAYESEAIRYNDFSIPPLKQTLNQLIEEAENSIILKAIDNKNIIGSVRGKLDSVICKVGRLIVHPDFQHRGIGSQLLIEIEHYFSRVKIFELFTGSDSENNIRLYKKFGYVESKKESLNEEIDLIFFQKQMVDM